MNGRKCAKAYRDCQIEGIVCHIVEYTIGREARYRVEVDGRVVDDRRGQGYRSSAAAEQAFKRGAAEARRFLILRPDLIKDHCEAAFGNPLGGDELLEALSATLDGIGITGAEKNALMRRFAEKACGR
jgi:hypothetical protein